MRTDGRGGSTLTRPIHGPGKRQHVVAGDHDGNRAGGHDLGEAVRRRGSTSRDEPKCGIGEVLELVGIKRAPILRAFWIFLWWHAVTHDHDALLGVV